jgi:hypothetical protein
MFKGNCYCIKGPSWWLKLVTNKQVNKEVLYLKWPDVGNLHTASQKEVLYWMSLLLSILFCSFTIEEFQNYVKTCPTVPYACLYVLT